MIKRIGLLVGAEPRFADAFSAACAAAPGIDAELAHIDLLTERPIGRYDSLVDRASRLLPSYRTFIRLAAATGTRVINDPRQASPDDALLGIHQAARAGLTVARTLLLPQKAYADGVDLQRGLRNQAYPFRWDEAFRYIGVPAWLRSAGGMPWKGVRLGNGDEALAHYDRSGARAMVLQQHIDAEEHLRVVLLGAQGVLLSAPVAELHAASSWRLRQESAAHRPIHALIKPLQLAAAALAWELCCAEFALAPSGPVLLSLRPHVPAVEEASETVFGAVVDAYATLAIEAARGG